jgi:glycine/D-amino acid oxidase-like deaminating enzyme
MRDAMPEIAADPYWRGGADPAAAEAADPPDRVDVAVVGAGYTGLHAALRAARGGRSTLVLDAGAAGAGGSTRNGGQISASVKPSFAALSRRFGPERARAIHGEGRRALAWIETMLAEEGIGCDFRRAGRFHAAHCPNAYEAMARTVADRDTDTAQEGFVVPRAEQRREIGTDFYHGGVVYSRHASLHPGKYHAGLLARVRAAGATVVERCAVRSIGREGGAHRLETERGPVLAREVVLATNGYTGRLIPWLARRLIPIGSYIVATEPLPRALIDRLTPTDRVLSDSRRVVYYYRPSPDRSRILFGGRVSAGEIDPAVSGQRLRAAMTAVFPELREYGITHSWMGYVAYSFDELAHVGDHEGVRFAAGYCGSGVSMASWLGMKLGLKILGDPEGATAFDGLPFPTAPLYDGRPWFLPAAVAWYGWRDALETRRGRKTTIATEGATA